MRKWTRFWTDPEGGPRAKRSRVEELSKGAVDKQSENDSTAAEMISDFDRCHGMISARIGIAALGKTGRMGKIPTKSCEISDSDPRRLGRPAAPQGAQQTKIGRVTRSHSRMHVLDQGLDRVLCPQLYDPPL